MDQKFCSLLDDASYKSLCMRKYLMLTGRVFVRGNVVIAVRFLHGLPRCSICLMILPRNMVNVYRVMCFVELLIV